MRVSLLMCLALLIGCGKSTTTSVGGGPSGETISPPTDPPIANLRSEYGTNTAAMDAKYKGKVVAVEGNDVLDIKNDGSGYVVEFVGGWNSTEMLPGIVAKFPASQQGEVAKLKPGAKPQFYGRVVGRVDGRGAGGYTVVLDDCRITNPDATKPATPKPPEKTKDPR